MIKKKEKKQRNVLILIINSGGVGCATYQVILLLVIETWYARYMCRYEIALRHRTCLCVSADVNGTATLVLIVLVCVLHIQPFSLPIDIHLNHCPCRFFNPIIDGNKIIPGREILLYVLVQPTTDKLCGLQLWTQNYVTEILTVCTLLCSKA